MDYSLIITANPFSDSQAATTVFNLVLELDIISGKEVTVFLPGFHCVKRETDCSDDVVEQEIDRMEKDVRTHNQDYHGSNPIFHVYSKSSGDLYFNDVDFYNVMSDMTDDCPNIEYIGRTELVVIPSDDNTILYDEVRSFNLEPFVEGYVRDYTLKQFLLSVINILKKQKKNGEQQRLETLDRIEAVYTEQTKSFEDYGFTEVSIRIDNAILKHMKWTEQSERFFISYSNANRKEAFALKTLLEKESRDVWMAPEGIPVPMSYLCAVPAAIRISSRFIVLLSETSAKSKWVKREIEKAVKVNRRIDGVLLNGFTTEKIQEYESLDFLLSQVQIRYSLQELLDNKEALSDLLH